jgi:uncharacterized protein
MTVRTAVGEASAIYVGRVVHKRLSPRQHAFTYRVFSLALDVDEIDDLSSKLRLFARNRRALISFYDADHGRGDGALVASHIRTTLAEAGLAAAGARVVLLCYPRLFGLVFNPLSVYFCHEGGGRLGAVVYEVSNTFRERISYVIPVVGDHGKAGHNGTVRQVCAKQMYVSPFTPRAGEYSFHVSPPGPAGVTVGVALRDGRQPLLKTHFRGSHAPLDDKSLATVVARHPMMAVKVLGGIHLEAARLWAKGVPLVERHQTARYSMAVAAPIGKGAANV